MVDSIETFVEKLQNEGVEAGKQAAEKIQAQAKEEAARIVQDAQAEAERIIAEAKKQAEGLRARTETELRLAARDTAIRLQDTLARGIRRVVAAKVEDHLADAEFLKDLIRAIVLEYVQADTKGKSGITINVPKDMFSRLADWAVDTLHKAPEIRGRTVDLRGVLAEAGFEYTAEEGTIEVTLHSVVEVLSEFLGPEVRHRLQEAMKDPTSDPERK